jgi:hypothetical protein
MRKKMTKMVKLLNEDYFTSELVLANTQLELQILYKKSDHPLRRKLVLEKWTDLSYALIKKAKTGKEAKKVYEYTPHNFIEPKVRRFVFQWWHTISLKEIEEAKTAKEVRQIQKNAPEVLQGLANRKRVLMAKEK